MEISLEDSAEDDEETIEDNSDLDDILVSIYIYLVGYSTCSATTTHRV